MHDLVLIVSDCVGSMSDGSVQIVTGFVVLYLEFTLPIMLFTQPGSCAFKTWQEHLKSWEG